MEGEYKLKNSQLPVKLVFNGSLFIPNLKDLSLLFKTVLSPNIHHMILSIFLPCVGPSLGKKHLVSLLPTNNIYLKMKPDYMLYHFT